MRTAYCQGSARARASGIAVPRMAPIAAGPAPSRKALRVLVVAEPVEASGAEQHEGEGGSEGDERGEQPAAEAGCGVADDRDGLHDRARGDLSERDRVQKLAAGQPVVAVDRVVPA